MILSAQEVAKADVPNLNNRLYKSEVLADIVKQADGKTIMFGELLPQRGSTQIDMKNVSHVFKNLRLEGDQLLADIEVLNTPRGKDLEKEINANPQAHPVDFRLRGYCCMEGIDPVVITDYKLISIDAVFNGA